MANHLMTIHNSADPSAGHTLCYTERP